MTTDPGDIIAAPIRECFGADSPHEYVAMRILAALTAAGYEVIKVAEPNADGRWSISGKNDLYAEDGEVVQFLPKSSGAAFALRSPALVRRICAALLGAAKAAEAKQ